MKKPIRHLEKQLNVLRRVLSTAWVNRRDLRQDILLETISEAKQFRDAIRILNAVEREAVGEQVNPEEDFYCMEFIDCDGDKCTIQCPYCEKV